jgi:hypothetical protein
MSERKEDYWLELQDSEPFKEGHDNKLLWATLECLMKETRMTNLDIMRVTTLLRAAYKIGAASADQ